METSNAPQVVPDTLTAQSPSFSAEEVEQAKKEYRAQLLEWQHASQGSYDKTVIYLSAGALGVSFTFLRDFVGDQPAKTVPFLMLAWGAWAVSLLSALAAFYTSAKALGKAVDELDAGSNLSKPGGRFNRLTNVLNPLSGFLLFVGIVSLSVFVYFNLGKL